MLRLFDLGARVFPGVSDPRPRVVGVTGSGGGVDGVVRLEPWGEGDLWLLRRLNSAETTAHLGGPESEERLLARHRRYVELGDGRMYRVVLADDERTVGSVGYWEREWRGGPVWEAGWAVLPGFQGRGLAAAAARAVVEAARAAGRHRYLHAYPKVTHAASNTVCRRAGFTLLGEVGFEYPKGNPIRCNDWRYDLAADGS
ncbi:GNAT family N-acetyltransferase [Streptomyces broussonetiae]|uniref:GNAT family N-acetyltransferase n=1 Tax=Streptomyces broussonetiae TaxID=2686304 RepID=A0ABV5E2Z1_9ACTN